MQNTDCSARGTIERLHLTANATEIAEHVTARLGPDVEITLEVRARNEDGFDDATRRTVSENATNLGSRSSEFE